jgi:hypothetical protein
MQTVGDWHKIQPSPGLNTQMPVQKLVSVFKETCFLPVSYKNQFSSPLTSWYFKQNVQYMGAVYTSRIYSIYWVSLKWGYIDSFFIG